MPSRKNRSKANRARKTMRKKSAVLVGLLMRTRSARTDYLESEDDFAVYSELRWRKCTDGMPGYIRKRVFKLPREAEECMICCEIFCPCPDGNCERSPCDLPCICPTTACRKCMRETAAELGRPCGCGCGNYLFKCPTCNKDIRID